MGKVKWYRIVDLAAELGVTRQTIGNWITDGKVVRGRDESGRKRVRLADGVRIVVGK